MLDWNALYLAGLCVWAVVSAVVVAILTGWVIALRHQVERNNRRLAFLELDYEAKNGVHPFVVMERERQRFWGKG